MKPLPLVLAVGLFGIGWVLAPGPAPESLLVQARKDIWRLPELPQRTDQSGRAIGLATAPIFEPEASLAAAAASAAKPEDKRWRVSGIFGRGAERKVLISFALPGKEPLRLAVGDKVPSGERIVRIDDSEVLIRVGKKQLPLGAGYRE